MKLIEALLYEAPENAKAIIMAGAAGAGKTYLAKSAVIPNAPGFKYMNPDTYIEREEEPMNLTQASAQVDNKDVPAAVDSADNFIWDTTASSAAKMVGGLFRKKQVPGLLSNETYDFMMIMVYADPMVSFLRNFQRERRVPKVAVLSTWNKVYGNIGAYSSKLGNSFMMYQAPVQDVEIKKEVEAFEAAHKAGRLKEYFTDLLERGGDRFSSSFKSEVPDEELSPEELEKRQKSRAKTQELFQAQIIELTKQFGEVKSQVDKYLKTEQEIASRVKQFVG